MIISSDWSSLIHFDPFWKDLIQSDQKKIWKSDDIFQWLFHQKSNLIQVDPFWTDLIQFNQKINKFENLMIYFNDYFIRNQIWSSLIHFDPFRTDLIHFYQKMNEVESLMIYFNDYFIRKPIWSRLIHFGQIWFNSIKK